MKSPILPIFAFLLVVSSFVFSISVVEAAKPFPKKASTSAGAVKKTPVRRTSGIPSVAKLRADRRAVLLSFSSFAGIESADYSFTYTHGGKTEGAGGTIRASNNPSTVRELAFGTCSTNVCSYHSGIRDAKLTIVAKYTNGSKKTKIYRIKV